MKRRTFIRLAVLTVWLGAAAWLARREVFPGGCSERVSGGYRSLFAGDVLLMDSWMKLLFNGKPIGFSHTSLELDEKNPRARHTVLNRIQARMNIMGTEQRVFADTIVRLSDDYDLQSFAFVLAAEGYRLRLDATRGRGDLFDVTITTDSSTQHTTVEVPRDVILYSPMTEMAMRRLRPGQTLTLRTLDPTTLGTSLLTVKALRRETIVISGEEQRATVLSADYHGASVLSWMNDRGDMLRQETPFGWTLEKCGMDEALAAISGARPSEDMLAGMAVPCQGTIGDARAPSGLRLRLRGVEFQDGELASDRQRVESRDGETLVLRSLPATALRVEAAAGSDLPEDVRAFLRPSLSLQSEHAEVRARAEAITRDCRTPAAKALALHAWVHENVAKVPTVSLPSALDVLRTLKGDCNEHSTLYAALARAVGLPAKVKVGLAYHEKAFYYHAWPAVYVDGIWHELDPTWGQDAVDATHLALAEGELADQLALVKAMGRLKIDVLEDGAEPADAGRNNGSATGP